MPNGPTRLYKHRRRPRRAQAKTHLRRTCHNGSRMCISTVGPGVRARVARTRRCLIPTLPSSPHLQPPGEHVQLQTRAGESRRRMGVRRRQQTYPPRVRRAVLAPGRAYQQRQRSLRKQPHHLSQRQKPIQRLRSRIYGKSGDRKLRRSALSRQLSAKRTPLPSRPRHLQIQSNRSSQRELLHRRRRQKPRRRRIRLSRRAVLRMARLQSTKATPHLGHRPWKKRPEGRNGRVGRESPENGKEKKALLRVLRAPGRRAQAWKSGNVRQGLSLRLHPR